MDNLGRATEEDTAQALEGAGKTSSELAALAKRDIWEQPRIDPVDFRNARRDLRQEGHSNRSS